MAQSGSSGSTAFNLQKRTLTLKPVAADVRVAIFSGSELQSPAPDMLTYLRQTQADVFIVLGGLGRSSAQALETARSLATLQRLVLIVRGGADGFDLSVAAPANVLDASALRSVRIGQDNLLLWPGAEQGRYALAASHCGFGEPELQVALDELAPPEPGERRWLLTWQAPELGSQLAGFAVRAGAAGVLYAWPPSAPSDGLATETWDPAQPQLVPRAWGPRMEARDGHAMEHGARVLRFDHTGPHEAR
jgi:hypothetical protein